MQMQKRLDLGLGVISDVWVSSYPGEENLNMGAARKLKLKGIQEMAILDFDLASIEGRKVENGRLYFCDTNKKNKLRKIGISTVASSWIEGKSRGYFVDVIGRGATFSYSSYKQQRWAGDKSDLTYVTMGNGYTWQHHTELKREDGMWWSVDIAPSLIHAIIANKSYGLLIMDESGQTITDNYVFSRESRHSSPYMMITYREVQKKEIPEKLKVELSTSYENAHIGFGAVIMKVFIKEKLLAYDIYINGERAPLWRVPKPGPTGSIQEIILDWLPPEKKINIKILAVDGMGQRSEPVLASGYSSKSLPKIRFSAYEIPDHVKKKEWDPSFSKKPHIWAVPETTKVDPVSGEVFGNAYSEEFNKRNPIWSAEKREITILGVKGEIIGFQLVVEIDDQHLGELQLGATQLIGSGRNIIKTDHFAFYQVHYVKKTTPLVS